MKAKYSYLIIALSISLIALVTVIVVIFVPKNNGGPGFSEPTSIFIAHRGSSDEYIDNSVDAFKSAGKGDYYGIETDVYLTKDNVYVCNHDSKVELNGLGTVSIEDMTWEDLQYFNTKRSGKPLVTLTEFLSICKDSNKYAVVELKEEFEDGDCRLLFNVIDEKYSRERVIIQSFNLSNLTECQKYDKDMSYYYLSFSKMQCIVVSLMDLT